VEAKYTKNALVYRLSQALFYKSTDKRDLGCPRKKVEWSVLASKRVIMAQTLFIRRVSHEDVWGSGGIALCNLGTRYRLASRSGHFSHGGRIGCVGFWCSLDATAKRKFCPCRESNRGLLASTCSYWLRSWLHTSSVWYIFPVSATRKTGIVWIFEVKSNKFNVLGTSINVVYAQKWITKLYSYLFIVFGNHIVSVETFERK
jgi:hypothetical protein